MTWVEAVESLPNLNSNVEFKLRFSGEKLKGQYLIVNEKLAGRVIDLTEPVFRDERNKILYAPRSDVISWRYIDE